MCCWTCSEQFTLCSEVLGCESRFKAADSPHVLPGVAGAAELLSARAMALMLCLSNYEATGFLDEAASQLPTSSLLDQCADHVLGYAGKPFFLYIP